MILLFCSHVHLKGLSYKETCRRGESAWMNGWILSCELSNINLYPKMIREIASVCAKFLSILPKKNTFSILHTHFYKTLTLVYLFYHLFYLNNNISLIFYYIKQTTTHMALPTSFFLFLTPTLSFSLNHLLLSCFSFPSSFFSLFFLFLQQISQT